MGSKFRISVVFFGFQKNEYFLGMKILWVILGGHHKIRLYFGVVFMHFWSFLRSRYRMGGILGGC